MGARILAHLLAAADRGVRVRILLDDSFTEHEDLALYHLDLHTNIQLCLYNPYHARVDSMAGRTLFNLGDFSRVNHRMHNKALIVDGWAVTLGGRNLADECFGLHGEYNFRDMEVLAMGDSVIAVSQQFRPTYLTSQGWRNYGRQQPIGLSWVRLSFTLTSLPILTPNSIANNQTSSRNSWVRQ